VHPYSQDFYDNVAAEVAHNGRYQKSGYMDKNSCTHLYGVLFVVYPVTLSHRRLAHHPSLVVYSGNNEGSVFGDVELFVGTQLTTMQV
jgi:hypothetical protein